MNVSKVIKEHAEPRLKQLGFSLDESRVRSGVWTFTRYHAMTLQHVIFVRSNHKRHSLKVQLTTSFDPVGVESWMLVNGGETRQWMEYQDNDSLVHAVETLLSDTIEHGIPWFTSR